MLLNDEKIKELASSYLEEYRICRKSDDFFEAWESVRQITEQSPDQGMELVKRLVFLAKDEEELAYIAAGPLEDLIDYHAEAIQEDLRILVRQMPLMRRAMKHVWHTDPNTPAGNLMKNLEYLWK